MKKPLEGIRVVEFTHVISGPYCGMLLGDLGAEVIKVENSLAGEYSRSAGAKAPSGVSLWYPSFNRNKKAITLNLKHEKSKEILRSLIKKSDVLLENFRPGLLDELGFSYEALTKVNPALIMASISGFGKNGPYEKKTAFDMTAVALSGFMSINGLPQMPMKTGPATSDFLSGLYGALYIVSAVRYRDLTGKGQFIDVSMMDSAMAILESAFAEYKILGKSPERIGNRRPNNAPSNVFKAKDDFIYIAALFQKHWENLCKLMNRDDLLDKPEYKTMQERYKHADEIEAAVSAWVKNYSAEEIVAMLEDCNIPCAHVKNIADVMADPHVVQRKSIVQFDYPGLGRFPVVAPPARFSEIPFDLNRPPLLGENNEEIFCSLLGYNKEEYKALKSDNVI